MIPELSGVDWEAAAKAFFFTAVIGFYLAALFIRAKDDRPRRWGKK